MAHFLSLAKKHIYDGIALLVLVACSLICFIFTNQSEEAKIAKVYYQSETVLKIELNQDADYFVQGAHDRMKLRVEDKAIWVLSSDCPTQSCVHQGKISRSGQSIICAYNQISIMIGGDSFEVDI